MDKGDRASDRVEAETMQRVREVYAGALETALRTKKDFFKKLADVYDGRYKPPSGYDEEQAKRWRDGFITELLRQDGLIRDISKALADAGGKAAPIIQSATGEIYGINRRFTVGLVEQEARKVGVEAHFHQIDKRQIDILLRERQTPFSKIAYKNLGNDRQIVRRLTTEMAQAVALGEGKPQIVGRIRKVTGQSIAQARRVAQTEGVRVQSQARQDALHEAAGMGLIVTKKWSAAGRNTRDTHAALDGTEIPEHEAFKSPSGAALMYPGDPSAPAEEVINCQCVLVPDVKTGNNGKIEKGKGSLEAKTKQEAEQYAKTLGVHADYSKFSVRVANEVNAALTDYVDVMGASLDGLKITHIGRGASRTAMGLYYPTQNKIELRNVAKSTAVDEWADVAKRMHERQWWSNGDKRTVIWHELGHATANTHKTDAAVIKKIEAVRQGIIDASMALNKAGMHTSTKSYLSEYGMKNVNEFIAESVAEYVAGSPRETAQRVVDIIKGGDGA